MSRESYNPEWHHNNVFAVPVGADGTTPASASNPAPVSSIPYGMEYERVAASDTDEAIGAAGSYLSHIVIEPITTAAGAVTVKDGATTIFLFTSGTLADLSPKTVPFGVLTIGALTITTGANVTVLAVGNFI